jgi:hypothetical protein
MLQETIVTRLTTEWNALGCPLSVTSTHSARRSKELEASFTGVSGHSLRPQRVIREKHRGVCGSSRESARPAAGRRTCRHKCVPCLFGTEVASPSAVCSNVASNLTLHSEFLQHKPNKTLPDNITIRTELIFQ